MRKFLLYFMVFGLSFIAFDKVEAPIITEEIYADKNEYVFNFEEVTVEGEKIVLFDNRGLNHIQYYVIEFSGSQYAHYTYYYMNNHQEYTSLYGQVAPLVVDYNYDEYMIKTLDRIEYGTYDSVIESLFEELENDTLYVIY